MANRISLIAHRTSHPAPCTTFVNARVLGSHGIIASSLRMARGHVAALDVAPHAGDVVIDLHGAVVAPGLINAHDHLELNNFGRLKWHDRYTNVRGWIDDFRPRFDTDPVLSIPRAVPLPDRLLIGALKNLLSGVTTVCHHNPLHRPLRRGYPVRVVTRYRYSHSLLLDGDSVADEYRRTPEEWPWIIHLAEGTDAEAAAELVQLDRLGCLGANTIIVHGVGLTPEDRASLIERGGGLVWCPSSNLFMLGATADVRDLLRAGKVALGSDSRLSGERDLLDELRAAHATGQVGAPDLFRMITVDAARMLRLPDAGRIAPGLPADLVLFTSSDSNSFESILRARRSDLRLVMIGGRPLVGDLDLAPVFDAAHIGVTRVCLDGRDKWMDQRVVDRLRRSSIGEAGLEIAV